MASASKRRIRPPADDDLRRGLTLFNERRYAEAAARFQAALDRRPRSPRAASGLAHSLGGHAQTLLAQGRIDEALRAFEKARALLPADQGLALCLAQLYLRVDRAAQAETVLRDAVERKAGAEASLLLAELLAKRGDSAEAARHLRRAAREKPAGEDARAALAAGVTRFKALVKLRAFADAFREADALLASQGTQECIDAFLISPAPKDLMPTLDALRDFSAKRPDDPWPRYFRASLLTNAGRGEEAIAEAEKLKSAPARCRWMRHKLGEFLLSSRRDYEAAQTEYEAAVSCVPGFWKARAALAEIALCRGREDEALRLAFETTQALPDRLEGWGLAFQGKLLLWAGRYEEALESLEPAVSAAVPYAVRHRGAARLMLGRLDVAAADLEAGLAQGPEPEGLTWRGELRRRRGDLPGALKDLGAAIRQDNANSFWALANRGLARAAAGDAAGLWADYSTIRRDVLDRFERAAGVRPGGPADAAAQKAALEAGLALGRGLRVANEYLFPVWMRNGQAA